MRSMLIKKKIVGFLSLLFPVLMTPASAQEHHENVVLAVTPSSVLWAAVHRTPQHDDPYYHVEVFEKKKGSEPWLYTRLVPHLAVTPEALAASRVDKKAKLYAYKDLEFSLAYRTWLSNRENTPVCTTNILSCLGR